MSRPRLAVFASGTGSNFMAIAKATRDGGLDADLALLFCDQPHAPVLKRAAELGVASRCFSPAEYESRAGYEGRLRDLLVDQRIDGVALAGYMRIIGQPLLDSYPGRILNIHPSLLPAFPGRHAIAEAYAAGATETGVTVHFIDAGVDTGPIIAQRSVPLIPGESLEGLTARVHRVEHELYPEVLQQVMGGKSE